MVGVGLTACVLLAGLCTASPTIAQTADAPFGDVAHLVVRVDGVNFHYVTAGSGPQVWILVRVVRGAGG